MASVFGESSVAAQGAPSNKKKRKRVKRYLSPQLEGTMEEHGEKMVAHDHERLRLSCVAVGVENREEGRSSSMTTSNAYRLLVEPGTADNGGGDDTCPGNNQGHSSIAEESVQNQDAIFLSDNQYHEDLLILLCTCVCFD